jgi:hypothetical protein
VHVLNISICAQFTHIVICRLLELRLFQELSFDEDLSSYSGCRRGCQTKKYKQSVSRWYGRKLFAERELIQCEITESI